MLRTLLISHQCRVKAKAFGLNQLRKMPMPNPTRKDDRLADYAKPARRKVGDVDPVGKAQFEAELNKFRQPPKQAAARTKTRAASPKSAPEKPRESTYTKANGALRTRRERIEYEVDKATGD